MGQRRPTSNTSTMESIIRISAIAEKYVAKGYVLAQTRNGSGRGWLGLVDEAGSLVCDALLLSAKTFADLSNAEVEDRDEEVLNLRITTVTAKDGGTVTMAVRDGSSAIFAGATVRMFGK